jgi:hypothetical protein
VLKHTAGNAASCGLSAHPGVQIAD